MDIVKDTHHHLDMPLGLHVAAHDPETHQGLFVPGHESRNDGVKGAFAATDTVRVTFLQDKPAAAVL